jgi:hypothetical protein
MPVENGVYVRYSDFEALEAEARALRAYREMARQQVYELMGVVVDIEQFGSGFDEACMNTVKRVMGELAETAKETA